jgi:hypothetical protein
MGRDGSLGQQGIPSSLRIKSSYFKLERLLRGIYALSNPSDSFVKRAL